MTTDRARDRSSDPPAADDDATRDLTAPSTGGGADAAGGATVDTRRPARRAKTGHMTGGAKPDALSTTADSATVAARPTGTGRESSGARSAPRIDPADRRGHWADAARRGGGPRFLDGGLLDGRYRLVKQLGEGGMGSVYLVDDLLLRQRSALKTLHLDPSSQDEDLERFRREVALTHNIHHPNVARTYDIGEAGGVHYLSMEWLEGESLMARIKRGELLDSAEARALAVPLCRGLRAAHRAGVVHRDLKPANIMMVNDERQVVLVDFGIAAHILDDDVGIVPAEDEALGEGNAWQVTSAGRGTPAYMAPEQWNQEKGDARTDVYALGVILYVALTGKAPFQAATTFELAEKHRVAPAPDVREERPEVDKGLARLIQRCMAKAPADRPQTMGAVLAALRAGQRRRAWALASLITLVSTALAAVVLHMGVFNIAKTSLIQEMQPSLRRLAELTARDLPKDDLIKMGLKPDPQSLRYRRVERVLQRFRARDDAIKSVYVMAQPGPPNKFVIVADNDYQTHDDNLDGVIQDSEQGVELGSDYDGADYPAMQRSLDTGEAQADAEFAVDAWGVSLSGYAPVTLPGESKPRMFVGVDAGNAQLSTLKARLDTVLVALAVAFVLGWAALTWPLAGGGTPWRRWVLRRLSAREPEAGVDV